jgi:hypothetical protein
MTYDVITSINEGCKDSYHLWKCKSEGKNALLFSFKNYFSTVKAASSIGTFTSIEVISALSV